MKGEDVKVIGAINRMGNKLNLVEHGIKGFNDIIPRFVASPADLRVYLGSDDRLHALKFWRVFPPDLSTFQFHCFVCMYVCLSMCLYF